MLCVATPRSYYSALEGGHSERSVHVQKSGNLITQNYGLILQVGRCQCASSVLTVDLINGPSK
jgi:hypothetical protein